MISPKFNGIAPIYTRCKCECGKQFIKKTLTQRYCFQPGCAQTRGKC